MHHSNLFALYPEIQSSRVPKPEYAGTDGFFEKLIDDPSTIDFNETKVDEQALQKQRRAQFFFEHQGRPVPSFEEMEAEVQKDELDLMDSRIAALKSQHRQDLEQLYALSAAEFKQEIHDQYLSRDHTGANALSEQERAAWHMELMSLYDYSKNIIQRDWQNVYEHVCHSYQQQHLSLLDAKKNLQRARDQMFPRSKEEFFSKNKDIRLRAARFLVADQARQEKSLGEFGWAWRQVEPLMEVFKNDQLFAAEIRALVLSEQSVRDPRKPRT